MNENPCSNQDIHVLFEHGSEHTLKEPFIICMTLYTESDADQTDHSADVFVLKNVASVMTFESTQPTPFLIRVRRLLTAFAIAAYRV